MAIRWPLLNPAYLSGLHSDFGKLNPSYCALEDKAGALRINPAAEAFEEIVRGKSLSLVPQLVKKGKQHVSLDPRELRVEASCRDLEGCTSPYG